MFVLGLESGNGVAKKIMSNAYAAKIGAYHKDVVDRHHVAIEYQLGGSVRDLKGVSERN